MTEARGAVKCFHGSSKGQLGFARYYIWPGMICLSPPQHLENCRKASAMAISTHFKRYPKPLHLLGLNKSQPATCAQIFWRKPLHLETSGNVCAHRNLTCLVAIFWKFAQVCTKRLWAQGGTNGFPFLAENLRYVNFYCRILTRKETIVNAKSPCLFPIGVMTFKQSFTRALFIICEVLRSGALGVWKIFI